MYKCTLHHALYGIYGDELDISYNMVYFLMIEIPSNVILNCIFMSSSIIKSLKADPHSIYVIISSIKLEGCSKR